MDKYQVMPPLTEQEYQELKASIAKYGVQVAVEYDEDGDILDGHHRVKACEELGITNWPKVVKVGMDENQKLDYALMINSTRRQLTREQKRELIRQQLKRTPEKSDRQIAEMVGTSNSTVSEARKDMVKGGQLCESHTSSGADGKSYPRQTKPVTLYQPDRKDIDLAKSFIDHAVPELVEAVAEGKVPVLQAHAVADHADHFEQKEALRRIESGEANYLMEGLNQQRMEQCCQITSQKHKEIEEKIHRSDAEINRIYDISKMIDKAILGAARLPTNKLADYVRLYIDYDDDFNLDVVLMDIRKAYENLFVLKKEFEKSKVLRVVK